MTKQAKGPVLCGGCGQQMLHVRPEKDAEGHQYMIYKCTTQGCRMYGKEQKKRLS